MGVLDSPDCSNGTTYPLTENYTLLVTQVTGCVAYLSAYLYIWNVVSDTYNQSDTWIPLFAGAAVTLTLVTQGLVMFIRISSWVPHYISPGLLYIWCHTLPLYISLWDVVTYENTVIASDILLAVACALPLLYLVAYTYTQPPVPREDLQESARCK
jgi:hypothetical protein